MRPFGLFNKSSTYNGLYLALLTNRLQMLYFILIIPTYLAHPYMIWGIITMGLLSQINLMMLSKWLTSEYAAKGYQGVVDLFGKRVVRIFACFGLCMIGIKITCITLGYLGMVHQFIFATMSTNWLVFFSVLLSIYVASKGMENTIRFVIITVFSAGWIIVVTVPCFLPPIASLKDLYPIIPTDWSKISWKGLLLVYSAMSGPEYLLCIAPWLRQQQKTMKYLMIANAVTIVEYLLMFVASLLFFGSHYLSITSHPMANIARYMQSPIFERVDIILISLHMFNLIFASSILMLCFYGAGRIVIGKVQEQTTRTGFIAASLVILITMLIINKWFWKPIPDQNIWLQIQTWSGAITYFLFPALLLLSIKLKERA